jgi:protein TonB
LITPPDEPAIPEKLKWPLAALWISLGLHGALIAWVQIAPPQHVRGGGTIEARLVSSPQTVTSPHLESSVKNAETLPIEIPKSEPKAEPQAASISEPPPASPGLPSPSEAKIPRLEIPVAVDLNYYTALELDQRPDGEIPEPALPAALSGRIKFQVKIEENGRVSDVEVLTSDPAGAFDTAALEAASEALRTAHFKPGVKNGQPVRALVIYELTINPAGAEHRAR